MKNFYEIKEVAQMLGVSRQRIYQLIREGALHPTLEEVKYTRLAIPQEEVQSILESGKVRKAQTETLYCPLCEEKGKKQQLTEFTRDLRYRYMKCSVCDNITAVPLV